MSPRYKSAIWGDSGYDAVEHLIDSDPSELASVFRRTQSALEALVEDCAPSLVDSFIPNAPSERTFLAAQSVLREWHEATAHDAEDDDL